jgi:hypothetical protein
MGQRHQIYVKIANPLHQLIRIDSTKKKALEKEFGTGEFAILGYHNQWMYGRSALENCLRLLNFAKQFSYKDKTDKEGWGPYNSPICPASMRGNFNTVESIANGIGMVMNLMPVKTEWLEAGINSSWYEKGNTNHDFTSGDNNDGIHIVDMVTNKYCFMNITRPYKDKTDELSYSSYDLPYLIPVDALAYVRAYYGETIETCNPYYFERAEQKIIYENEGAVKKLSEKRLKKKIDIATQKVLLNNVKINHKQWKSFNEFGLLTLDDLRVMFPKMKQLKTPVTA